MERFDEACSYREKSGRKNLVQVVRTVGMASSPFEITAEKPPGKGSRMRLGQRVKIGKCTTYFKDDRKKYGKIS
jgi:hypothetical protein